MNGLHYPIPLLIAYLHSGSTGGGFEFPNIGHKVMIPQFPSGRVTAAEGVPRQALQGGGGQQPAGPAQKAKMWRRFLHKHNVIMHKRFPQKHKKN